MGALLTTNKQISSHITSKTLGKSIHPYSIDDDTLLHVSILMNRKERPSHIINTKLGNLTRLHEADYVSFIEERNSQI